MNSQTLPSETKTMTDFRPFEAWRYDPAKVDMNRVIAPPYDVISPADQQALYERSPYNCVRLILNKIETSDNEVSNRYSRAAKFYQQWQREQVVVQEEKPSFYLYRQTFRDPRNGKTMDRTALLGKLHLEAFEKEIVIPHEKTLSKPRADRRKLLEATETNFSPVFGLYEDPNGDVSSVRHEITKTSPLFEALDDQGVRHSVWVVNQPAWIERIQGGMSKRKIYIADGHHRYQTALEYGAEKRKQDGNPDQEMPYDFVLMALIEFNDPGLILLPTHRVILPYAGFNAEQALKALEPYFKFESMPLNSLKEKLSGRGENKPTFGLILEGKEYLMTLEHPEEARKKMLQGKPDVWYGLDVNLLAHLVFKLWNIDENMWENVLRFTRFEDEAASMVQSGTAKAAFLLRAPQVDILRDMGNVRELMPQKSTYFHPKLASGLVFYSHS